MTQILLQIFTTKIGWFLLCIAFSVIFSILSNYFYWAQIALIISLLYPVSLTILFIIYAFIINPLRDRRERENNGL